jgi:multidrug efflux pump subunit AcrA (membrane-fusion protein)
LAQGELVPANPVVVRSPLDGVVDVFHIKPNSSVQQGEPLFGFDEVLIKSRLDLAQQTLQTAETDYRQTAQMALVDSKYKSQLALMMGKIEEKRAELYFLAEQLNRARVVAPQAGVVLMDDPSEWIGRPISVGERILRIASQNDMEVEAWLPLADAITLEPGSGVTLYLNSSPLSPVQASVRYVAHDAVQRPEGHYAYRVRATLTEPSQHRVGLKGTAKLSGGWVLAGYWIFRRPLATLRAYTGF